MRYTILKSRDLYVVYEDEKIIAYFNTFKKAQDKINQLEYIDLMSLLMTNY